MRVSLSKANAFWTETGLMHTGGSRNQVELLTGAIDFFGDFDREIFCYYLGEDQKHIGETRTLKIWQKFDRKFETSGGWRINVPTNRQGGLEDYANLVVLFLRNDSNEKFDIRTLGIHSTGTKLVERVSMRTGGIHEGVKKRYGWYSY